MVRPSLRFFFHRYTVYVCYYFDMEEACLSSISWSGLAAGDLHAREIGRMSLEIIEAVKKFKIRHRPDDSLRVRIGMVISKEP